MPRLISPMLSKNFYQTIYIKRFLFLKLPDKLPSTKIFQKRAMDKSIIILIVSTQEAQNKIAIAQLLYHRLSTSSWLNSPQPAQRFCYSLPQILTTNNNIS